MAATLRIGIGGVLLCMLAGTCAWAAAAEWTRIASERSIAADSPEQHEVHEWLEARAAPGLGTLGAVRLGVTRVFAGQSPASAATSGSLSGLFPSAATDGNRVRILDCAGGRTEWDYRAANGQWVLQHYAALGDAPCDVAQPLPEVER